MEDLSSCMHVCTSRPELISAAAAEPQSDGDTHCGGLRLGSEQPSGDEMKRERSVAQVGRVRNTAAITRQLAVSLCTCRVEAACRSVR